MSNAAVARLLGVDPNRYSHYVNESREPDLEMLVAIAKVLRVTPNQLLGVAPMPGDADGAREALLDEMQDAARRLSDDELRIALAQIRAFREA